MKNYVLQHRKTFRSSVLENIELLMKQAAGEALPEGEGIEDDMSARSELWFECDMQNLRILKAITLDFMGQSKQALEQWEQCVNFAETRLPPNDESAVVVRVQAALCAWTTKNEQRARHHAVAALHIHNLIFGGGVQRFHRRYRKEFCLNLREDKPGEGKPIHEELWPSHL